MKLQISAPSLLLFKRYSKMLFLGIWRIKKLPKYRHKDARPTGDGYRIPGFVVQATKYRATYVISIDQVKVSASFFFFFTTHTCSQPSDCFLTAMLAGTGSCRLRLTFRWCLAFHRTERNWPMRRIIIILSISSSRRYFIYSGRYSGQCICGGFRLVSCRGSHGGASWR